VKAEMTKSEYARHRQVGPSAVSGWIKRGRLTAPALTAEGRIDVDLADAQLNVTLDPIMSASARSRAGRSAPAAPAPSAEVVVDLSSARQLLAARALSASIAAQQARINYERSRGRFMLTSAVEAEWGRSIGAFLMSVDYRIPDLAVAAGFSRQQLVEVRKWWREMRSQAAKDFSAAAAAEPEFVTDDPVAG
jgi:hypothetical protein